MRALSAGLAAVVLSLATAVAGPILDTRTGGLVGVPFGTAEEQALSSLTAVLGPPFEDTGWIEGCPLDGVDVRVLGWDALRAEMEETPDGKRFVRWSYVLLPEDRTGGPPPDHVILPGAVQLGETAETVAARLPGAYVEISDIFGVVFISTEEMVLTTFEPEMTAPVTQVGVPYVPTCE